MLSSLFLRKLKTLPFGRAFNPLGTAHKSKRAKKRPLAFIFPPLGSFFSLPIKWDNDPYRPMDAVMGHGTLTGAFFVEREEEEKGGYFLGLPCPAHPLIVYLQ